MREAAAYYLEYSGQAVTEINIRLLIFQVGPEAVIRMAVQRGFKPLKEGK